MDNTEGKQLEIKILLLTDDKELLHLVKDAVEDRYALFHAKELKQALVFEQLSHVAVFIADANMLMGHPGPVLDRLQRRAPGMVPIIAGVKNETASLEQLAAEGRIFRVLAKPCQPGQTRLYIEGAVKQAMQARGIEEDVTEAKGFAWKVPAMIAGAAAVLVSVALVVPWGGDDESGSGTAQASAATMAGQQLDAGQIAIIDAHFESARLAVEQEAYFSTDGNGAADHYQQILIIQPENTRAIQGLDSVADAMFKKAEMAMLDDFHQDAAQIVARVKVLRPDHPRLDFFESLINREQEGVLIEQAQFAVSAGEFELAFGLLTEASTSGSAMPEGMDDVVLGGVLDQATGAIAGGQIGEALDLIDRVRVVSPDYYRLIVVEKQLEDKHRSMLAQAREEAGNENFDAAEEMVRQAQLIPLGSASETRKVIDAIAAARKKAAEPDPVVVQQQKRNAIAAQVEALNVQFEASLTDNRLIAPREGNAQYFLEEMYRLNPDSEPYRNGAGSLASALTTRARDEMIAQEFVAAENWLAQAETLSADQEDVLTARDELEQAWASSAGSEIIPATNLTIVSFVQPDYPSLAMRRRVEGWVDIQFTVTADGSVTDIEIVAAEKKGYFEDSAMEAVAQWRFEPNSFRGREIDQRVASRLQFKTQ